MTTLVDFPDPSQATEDGVVAVGGELDLAFLLSAYSCGIFPWPHEGYPLLWFCPWERGILEFSDLHIPKSLRKGTRKNQWRYTIDQAFSAVIRGCACVERPGQSGTWITEEIVRAYENLFYAGYAHSLEVWEGTELVGGIYGVFIANSFSAESMFFKKSNASKWALWQLILHLKTLGLEWIDVQMVTPVSESFGAKLIPQSEFLSKLRYQKEQSPVIFSP